MQTDKTQHQNWPSFTQNMVFSMIRLLRLPILFHDYLYMNATKITTTTTIMVVVEVYCNTSTPKNRNADERCVAVRVH